MLSSQEAKVVASGILIYDQIQHQGFFQQRLWATPKSVIKTKSLWIFQRLAWVRLHSDINVANIVLSTLHAVIRVLFVAKVGVHMGNQIMGLLARWPI